MTTDEAQAREEMRKRRELLQYMDVNQLRIRLNGFVEFSICVLLLSLSIWLWIAA